MKKWIIQAVVAFLWLAHTPAQAESGVNLAGTVKDPQGRAIPGAALTLVSRSGTASRAATTDPGGAYHFRSLPEGNYLVRVEASGFAPTLLEDVHLAEGTMETRGMAPIYGSTITQVYRFDGIHKVNLGASYRIPLSEFQAIRFFARTENIFNQTYFESGFPTPGRIARGGIQFDL